MLLSAHTDLPNSLAVVAQDVRGVYLLSIMSKWSVVTETLLGAQFVCKSLWLGILLGTGFLPGQKPCGIF